MTKFADAVVDKLLDGLAESDRFRTAFEDDPRAELEGIGHVTPEQDVGVEGKDPVLPFLKLKGGLASKAKIKANKDRMAAEYKSSNDAGTAGRIFGPFSICAE